MKQWLTQGIGIGGCMDTAVAGSWLYVISNAEQYTTGRGGCLRVFSLEEPSVPRQISIVQGLGCARQLIVRDGYAYVSAREDGIWIIDVHNPECPFVAVHYDSIEMATGIAIDGRWLYAACRNYGIEVIDVSHPSCPVHTAVLRTGEAQSVTVQDGIIYAGVWGTKEVVIIDARELQAPRTLFRIPLDGKGDGVYVKGNLLYAATGHHRRTESDKALGPEDPAYGSGSGLEIYDISNPEQPVRLSRISMSDRIYYPSYDMWSVTVADGYAYLTLSYHGAVVIDVHDPRAPHMIAQWQAWVDRTDPRYFDMLDPKRLERFRPVLPFDAAAGLLSPATNLALGDGYIYVSTGFSDLYAIPFAQARNQPLTCSDICPPAPQLPAGQPGLYCPPGQVHAVCTRGNHVFAACGNAGLHELLLEENGTLTFLRAVSTQGIAFDVKRCGEWLLVAEGQEGVSFRNVTTLEEYARYRDPCGKVIQQIALSPDERFALIHTGFSLFQFLDIQDMEHPRCVLSDGNEALGGIYGRQICQGILKKRYMAAHWNSRYIQWYDLSKNMPEIMPWKQQNIGFRGGMTVCKNKVLTVWRGGYFFYDPAVTVDFRLDEMITIPDVSMRGKPVVHENLLFLSDRVEGPMQVISIQDVNKPRLLYQEVSQGNPDLVTVSHNCVIWPLGYAGLKVFPLSLFNQNT